MPVCKTQSQDHRTITGFLIGQIGAYRFTSSREYNQIEREEDEEDIRIFEIKGIPLAAM